MTDPQDTLASAVDRAAEITWWNRNMTELADVPGVGNAPEFVENGLVEQKGPYVEYVEAPAFDDRTGSQLLSELGYDDAVIDAVREELFGGEEGHFYRHQAETMENIARSGNDNVLAVPTATGKTESFFLPILQHCLETDESGLKSIILYPMKTLGVDQLNRFVAYLDQINRYRNPDDRITVGIWDSDTPQRVGTRDYEIEDGSFVRGLESPREEDTKLKIFDDIGVGTEQEQYPWLRVTRESIRQGVDILLTNPEALDYMFVSDNPDTRSILGAEPGANPVEHIVFDEAHVWSGIQGAAISLLARRLKQFYADRDPQVTMVSATVDNPRELAADLTGGSEAEIDTVTFTGRPFPVAGDPDFGRFGDCDVGEITETLALARAGDLTAHTAQEQFDLGGAIETLREVRLLSPDDPLRLGPAADSWVRDPIDETLAQLLAEPGFDNASDVVQTRRGRNRLGEAVLEASGTDSGWVDFVTEHVPEVAQFAAWFDEGTTGDVGFLPYDELLRRTRRAGADNPEAALTTVMAFGRLAGIVTEKYHTFLKPPAEVYWCRDCERVTRHDFCRECGAELPELQFCKRCNEVYVETDEAEEGVSGGRSESDFRPVAGWRTDVGDCPGCNRTPNLTDVTIPTPTLFSYMLTQMSRDTPSEKTLVFSDSRATAESVADKIIDTEYGLMAETLYVRELLEHDGERDNYEVFKEVASRLREEYWKPLIQTDMDEGGEAYNFLVAYRDRIEEQAFMSNCDHLLKNALVTAAPVFDADDPVELAVRHQLYTLFALDPNTGFTKNKVEFDGLTRSKLLDRLEARLGFDRETIAAVIDDTLRAFLEAGILIEAQHNDVRSRVTSSDIDDNKKEEVREYLTNAKAELDNRGITENPESGLLTRSPKKDNSNLRLVQTAGVCPDCYDTVPAFDDGTTVDHCPDCGASLIVAERFSENAAGDLVADPGYVDIPSEWSYALDHWAHDVTTPIRGGSDPEFITVGIHKGDTPHAVRGAIEEGFRRDDPDVNVVSATPTMELGVDIGTLETVGQVGIPPTLTNYVQRSGRTGRSRGSSSLVVTAVRGDHPVDGHYYSDLDEFFDTMEPVSVPDPFEYEELLAGHVVTEVFGYLARNPHETNVFEKMYQIQETNKSIAAFVEEVRNRVDVLRKFTLDERADAVKRHVETVFGDPGVAVFERVFEGDGPLSLSHRVDNTYSKLVTGGGAAGEDVIERNRRLDQWLQQLGFLANYRSFGDKFPVTFSGKRDEISFEGSGRLYDMFPGEENDLGGSVTLHGNKYLVDDVRGTTESLISIGVCVNDDCGRPFHGYEPDVDTCPHCESALTETAVHGIDSVECRLARGGQRNYSTRGIMTTYVDAATDQSEETTEATVFGMDCEVGYGLRNVTDFVYAFERYHSSSSGKELLRSEALIERDSSTSDTASWREQMADAEQETYRPVGQQYGTRGVTLQFDETDLRSRAEAVGHDTASWAQALTSLEQALRRAISVVTDSDLDDFRVVSRTTDGSVLVHIVDARQGGNGVARQVIDQLDRVQRNTEQVADCDCTRYCDECLLLERTPAHYLENDLLHRRMLEAVLGQAAGTSGVRTEGAV